MFIIKCKEYFSQLIFSMRKFDKILRQSEYFHVSADVDPATAASFYRRTVEAMRVKTVYHSTDTGRKILSELQGLAEANTLRLYCDIVHLRTKSDSQMVAGLHNLKDDYGLSPLSREHMLQCMVETPWWKA